MKMSVLQYFEIFCIAMLVLVYGCNKEKDPINVTTETQSGNEYKYPKSKIWAHRANDTITAQNKKTHFDGLEVDVQYSSYDNELYVGHNEEDTINRLTLRHWFKSLDNTDKTCYWIDLKTLDTATAKAVGDKLLEILSEFNIKDKAFIENYSWEGLKILKEKGLHVMLWVDCFLWCDLDSTTLVNVTRSKIQNLTPDAISCEYSMFQILTDSFPEQNIHLWQTPAELNDENIEITRKLCRNKSVKVVLVDYDEPIDY